MWQRRIKISLFGGRWNIVNKNQIIIFIITFLIAGFFLVCKPEIGFSGSTTPGGPPCCLFDPGVGPTGTRVCIGGAEAQGQCESSTCISGDRFCEFFPNRECVLTGVDNLGACVPPPQIPTLNQWGLFIMAGMLGLFAVTGLITMRRRSAVS